MGSMREWLGACPPIPDRPILALLAGHRDRPCFLGPNDYAPDVMAAMPAGTSEVVALGKMRGLIRRGLVVGCACGCRGDFAITPAGLARLAAPRGG